MQLLGEARPQSPGAPRGNGEFVGAVAGEAHPRDPERRAIERAGREGHMRKALVVERDVHSAGLDEIPRARARDGERRPLRGRVVNDDAGGIEAILPREFEAHEHRIRVPRRAGDEKAIFAQRSVTPSSKTMPASDSRKP